MPELIAENFKLIPLPKNTLIVARNDGRLYQVDFTEYPQLDDPSAVDWDISISKLIVAKIQQTRTSLQTLEEIEMENIAHTGQPPKESSKDFQLTVFGTLDGKNNVMEVEPFTSIDEDGFVRAFTRVSARNFAIQIRGTYNINTISVTFHRNGRR